MEQAGGNDILGALLGQEKFGQQEPNMDRIIFFSPEEKRCDYLHLEGLPGKNGAQ